MENPADADRSIEAAIGWMVELSSGAVSERQRRSFDAWLKADPDHEAAWLRLQESLRPCGVAARQHSSRGTLARHLTARPSRRAVIGGLAGALGLGTTGGLIADRFVPLGDLLADHVTCTGQQSRVHLDDGSEIVLAPRTALALDRTSGRRAVRLIEGQLLLRVAAWPDPFRLDAGPLSLAAGSGSVLIERRADIVAATGLDGDMRFAFGAAVPVPLARGDYVALEGGQPRRLAVDVGEATAWLNGTLVATNQPVAAIVRALRPYFAGVIRLDPAVAERRASGVFPLHRPLEALDILAASLDLSIARVGRVWVALGPGTGDAARTG